MAFEGLSDRSVSDVTSVSRKENYEADLNNDLRF